MSIFRRLLSLLLFLAFAFYSYGRWATAEEGAIAVAETQRETITFK